MALLDVSEVIDDPLFTSRVQLIRMQETTDEYGNARWEALNALEADAVVTADAKAIARLPEELHREGTIIVRVLCRNVPDGFGAGYDEVLWRGRRFVVNDCADYSQFGSGFLRLVCSPAEVSDGGY